MIKLMQKKPVKVQTLQYTGENLEEVKSFIGKDFVIVNGKPAIRTLEGDETISMGDVVIRGVKGEFYPCKLDIFFETYEEAK